MAESLQLAQILADLQTLQQADSSSARALLAANKTLSPQHIRRKSKSAIFPEPSKFDKLGRRIVGPVQTTPAFSRVNSGVSSVGSSGFATPAVSPGEEGDVDVQRAKTLLQLFEQRAKYRQLGEGLAKAKARVDEAVASHAEKDLKEKEDAARGRSLRP